MCPEGKVCNLLGITSPISAVNNSQCVSEEQKPSIVPKSRYTGDFCNHNSDCVSSFCFEGICEAAFLRNGPCNIGVGTGGCPVGQFCNENRVCHDILPAGSTC